MVSDSFLFYINVLKYGMNLYCKVLVLLLSIILNLSGKNKGKKINNHIDITTIE